MKTPIVPPLSQISLLLLTAFYLAPIAARCAEDPPNFSECCEMRGQPDVNRCRKDPQLVKLCTPGAVREDVMRRVDSAAGEVSPPKTEEEMERARRESESLQERADRKKREVEERVRELESR